MIAKTVHEQLSERMACMIGPMPDLAVLKEATFNYNEQDSKWFSKVIVHHQGIRMLMINECQALQPEVQPDDN